MTWDKRWVYLNTNMPWEENAEQAHEIVEHAAGVGFNGIVLAGSKTGTWFHADFHMPSWERNVKNPRNRSRQLDFDPSEKDQALREAGHQAECSLRAANAWHARIHGFGNR